MSKTNKKSLFCRFQNLAIAKRITLIYGGIFSLSLLILSGFFFVNITILEQNSVRKQLEATIGNIEQFLDNGGELTNESLKSLLDNKYVEVSVFSYTENEGFNSHVGDIPAFIKQPPQTMGENSETKSILEGFWNKEETMKAFPKTEYHIRSLKELGINRQEFILEGPGDQKFMLLSTQYKNEGDKYQIQVFKQLNGNQYFMQSFLWKMLIADFIGIFCAFLAGRYISRRVLKPMEQIRTTAERISIEDLTQRIDLDGPDDEMKELTITFNSMIDRLEKAFHRQNQFVSDASHELRTPISVIQGYASLINRWGKSNPDVLQESIDSILSETEHMKELINNLLFLAKSDQNRMHAKRVRMCLNDVAQEIVKELDLLQQDRQITYEETEQVEINGDGDLIKQLLWIHGENALKYTTKGGKIHIKVWKDKKYAYVSIADDGMGIAEEEQSKIFDRFYREDKSRNKEISGTGLGLSIAKWIVSSHDGAILVESKRGEGATFIDCFPLWAEPEAKKEIGKNGKTK
ncbi:ATP-binding protein [Anaerotignum sp.]|uniref:sensor histidine kinase n=1 Tax=Anaerotignum sp. TaxID=2039241 RepID=UPI003736F00B